MFFTEQIPNSLTWVSSLTSSLQSPLLATTTESEYAPVVLTGVLLSLVVIYFASKLGGELSRMMDFPPVLGELVGGVVVGASALHLLVFPESGANASDSVIMNILQVINNLSPEAVTSIFQSQSEAISILAELGVIVLLFEIGLESDLRELKKVGYQAAIVCMCRCGSSFCGWYCGFDAFISYPNNSGDFCWCGINSYKHRHYLQSFVRTWTS
jgi:Kef-type K+ transport system membrane component KefB